MRWTRAIVLAGGLSVHGAVFTVTTTNDSGPGSLRQAILGANSKPDLDLISFSIPGEGPHRITPLTSLPAVTNSVVIDGYTQPGSRPNSLPIGNNAKLQIELHGARTTNHGIVLTRSGDLQRLDLSGPRFYLVRGLVINSFSMGAAIYVVSLPVSGPVLLEGNFLGTDPSGTTALTNEAGVRVVGATGVTIGGTRPQARNVISGNRQGVASFASGPKGSLLGAARARVLGNYIGVDATGAKALGNGQALSCSSAMGLGPAYLDIGDQDPDSGNVISGNGGAVAAQVRSGVSVRNNLIGLDAAGTGFLPNGGGITVGHYSGATVLDNVIAGNGDSGVFVSIGWDRVEGALIRRNSMFLNRQLGINLQPLILWVLAPEPENLPTPNDPGDADGAVPNFPIITGVVEEQGQPLIQGTYNSRSNITSVIDFFRSSQADPSGFGEGEIYLGTLTLSTDGKGNASFAWPAPESVAGQFITATATAGGTGEFSPAFLAPGVFAGNLQFSARITTAQRAEGKAVIEIIRTGSSEGACTVDVSTVDDTAKAGHDYVALNQTVAFATGETNKTLELSFLPRPGPGASKSLKLLLSHPTGGAGLGLVRAAALVLLDTGELPTLTAGEGQPSPPDALVFPARLSRASELPVTVDYITVVGGTAANNVQPAAGKLTFAPGEIQQQVRVELLQPLRSADVVSVVFHNPNNARLGDQFASYPPPPPPSLTIDPVTGDEGSEFLFRVNLARPAPVSFDWYVSCESQPGFEAVATPGLDVVPMSGTISFPENATAVTVAVPVLADSEAEGQEFFYLRLINIRGALALRDPTARGTIRSLPGLLVEDAKGYGPAGWIGFKVRLSEPVEASLDYLVGSGTANGRQDFLPQSGTIHFTAGSVEQTVWVQTVPSSTGQTNPSLVLKLHNPKGAALVRTEARGELVQSALSLSIEDDARYPGEAFSPALKLSYPNPVGDRVFVDLVTEDGGARAGIDYVPVAQRVYFAPGDTRSDISPGGLRILSIQGASNSAGRTFSVVVTNVGVCINGRCNATSTILINRGRAQCAFLDPSRPRLYLSRMGMLEWKPTAPVAWSLETATDPWQSGSWMLLPFNPQEVEGIFRLPLSGLTNARAFFRLRQQE